ncbi:MAG: hypothetical protein HZA67_10950 [Rhodospirillales bacterium]|nr:hypothetical protein [Rhodospirillales bacterium]
MSALGKMSSSRDDPVARANDYLALVSATEYAGWVREDLSVLRAAYRAFHHSPDGDNVRALSAAFQALQDLGGTFDYPLISEIGYMAVRFLGQGVPKSPKQLEFVHILQEAMELVIGQRISGDGGEAGAVLMGNIRSAWDKLRSETAAV